MWRRATLERQHESTYPAPFQNWCNRCYECNALHQTPGFIGFHACYTVERHSVPPM